MSPGWRRAAAACALAIACAAATTSARAADPRRIPLVDQNGSAFSIADLRGQPVAVTFVASRCTDACPIADHEFEMLAARLRQEHVAARLLTITLDPDYDTPFVMAGAAHGYGADARQWRFASGAPADVRRLMRAFNVTAIKDEHGIPDQHGTFVYVLDARGRLARTLLLSTNLVDEAGGLLRSKALAAR